MEYLFKIIVIGEVNVGKSSLIRRYVDNVFSQQYKYTIGVDFALKALEWGDDIVVRLQLWDIAGQERFGGMTRVYYKESAAAILVYDVSDRVTFELAAKWKEDLDAKVRLPNGLPVPCVLVGNKCDLSDRGASRAEVDDFVARGGFVGGFEISAKEDIGIDRAVRALVAVVLEQAGVTVNGVPVSSGGGGGGSGGGDGEDDGHETFTIIGKRKVADETVVRVDVEREGEEGEGRRRPTPPLAGCCY